MDKNLRVKLYIRYHGTIREDLERAIQTLEKLDSTLVDDIYPEEIERVEDQLGFDISDRVENIYQELSDIKKAIDYNGGVSDMTDLVLVSIDENNPVQFEEKKTKLLKVSQETQAKTHALGKLISEVILQFELAQARGHFPQGAKVATELEVFHDQLKLLELHLESQRDLVRDEQAPVLEQSDVERNMER